MTNTFDFADFRAVLASGDVLALTQHPVFNELARLETAERDAWLDLVSFTDGRFGGGPTRRARELADAVRSTQKDVEYFRMNCKLPAQSSYASRWQHMSTQTQERNLADHNAEFLADCAS